MHTITAENQLPQSEDDLHNEGTELLADLPGAAHEAEAGAPDTAAELPVDDAEQGAPSFGGRVAALADRIKNLPYEIAARAATNRMDRAEKLGDLPGEGGYARRVWEAAKRNPAQAAMLGVTAVSAVVAGVAAAKGFSSSHNVHTVGYETHVTPTPKPVHVEAPHGMLHPGHGHNSLVAPSSGRTILPDTDKLGVDGKGNLTGITDKQWTTMHKEGVTSVVVPGQAGHPQTTGVLDGKIHREWSANNPGGLDFAKTKHGLEVTYDGQGLPKGKHLELMVTDHNGSRVTVPLERASDGTYRQTIDASSTTGQALQGGHERFAEVVSRGSDAHGVHNVKVYGTETGDGTAKLPHESTTIASGSTQPTVEFMDVQTGPGHVATILTPHGVTSIHIPEGYSLQVVPDGSPTGVPGQLELMHGSQAVGYIDQHALANLGADGKLPGGLLKALNGELGHSKLHLISTKQGYALEQLPHAAAAPKPPVAPAKADPTISRVRALA